MTKQNTKQKKLQKIKLKKRIVEDDTRIGAMYCFKNCSVNVN